VLEVLEDLRGVGCDVVTIVNIFALLPALRGKRIRSSQVFTWYEDIAYSLGFRE